MGGDMLYGDFEAALDHNLRAAEVSLDPSSVLAERVVPLYYSGRFQEAYDLHRATIELGLKPAYQGPQAAMMLGDTVGGFENWVDFIRRQGVEIEDESEAAQWASGGDLRPPMTGYVNGSVRTEETGATRWFPPAGIGRPVTMTWPWNKPWTPSASTDENSNPPVCRVMNGPCSAMTHCLPLFAMTLVSSKYSNCWIGTSCDSL